MDDEPYVVVPAQDERAVEAWRTRWVEERRPFVALRVDGDRADVEYDLAHLGRWLTAEAVGSLEGYEGFHGRAYGMVRRVPLADAEAVAARVAELARSAESTTAPSPRV